MDLVSQEVKNKIDEYKTVTILTHLNPDADTLGTALGVYDLLIQDRSKKVEVVNGSKPLPPYLDFLPHYKKIKNKIDYKDSLIIACDCGSVDRLGFDLEGRDIINIDHHKSNTNYGNINIVDKDAVSASQVAYILFNQIYNISEECATCFYTALISDTQNFTTTNVDKNTFKVAYDLIESGANASKIASAFYQTRSLASLRILQYALNSFTLYNNAQIAILTITEDDIEASGALMSDMNGVVDYGLSLKTVKVAIFVMEIDNSIRISLRSKGLDISKVAIALGGGGHKVASGITFQNGNIKDIIDIILQKIKELGLKVN